VAPEQRGSGDDAHSAKDQERDLEDPVVRVLALVCREERELDETQQAKQDHRAEGRSARSHNHPARKSAATTIAASGTSMKKALITSPITLRIATTLRSCRQRMASSFVGSVRRPCGSPVGHPLDGGVKP
jgi:hypothetical protein